MNLAPDETLKFHAIHDYRLLKKTIKAIAFRTDAKLGNYVSRFFFHIAITPDRKLVVVVKQSPGVLSAIFFCNEVNDYRRHVIFRIALPLLVNYAIHIDDDSAPDKADILR
ncbi:MAG: hypothetical protein ABIR47_14245 [Candidatus Kapaibacterium sp.]